MGIPAIVVSHVRCQLAPREIIAILLASPETWITVNVRKERPIEGAAVQAFALSNGERIEFVPPTSDLGERINAAWESAAG